MQTSKKKYSVETESFIHIFTVIPNKTKKVKVQHFHAL